MDLTWSIRKRGVSHDSKNLPLANGMLELLLTEENSIFVEKTRSSVLATFKPEMPVRSEAADDFEYRFRDKAGGI